MLLSFCADNWFCIAWKADLVPSINSLYSVHIEYLPWMKKRGNPFKIFTHFCGKKKKTRPWCSMLLFCFASKDEILIYINFCRNTKYSSLLSFHKPSVFLVHSRNQKNLSNIKKNADIKNKWREERIKRVVCAWAKWLLPPFPSGSLFQFPQHELTRSVITLPWIGCQSIKRLLSPPPQLPRISSGFYDNFLVSINSWFEKAYWNKSVRCTLNLRTCSCYWSAPLKLD